MSSLFSGKSKSATSSSTSVDKKDALPPTNEVFTSPPAGAEPKKKWYDQGQQKQIDQLKAYTQTLILPESDPYYPWEARFLADPGCHPRYMRAAKWKFEDAKKRIKGTIDWRREYKPELIKPADVGIEAETGKIILTGFDVDARPILYMRPGRENTEVSPRQIQHLIYYLERAIDFMPPGQEQVAIVVDYKSATSQSNPSIGTARKVLNILQNHYVERLGRGLVVNMSWWINAFFSGISPFLDPITRDKIRFNPKMSELVPSAQLDHEFGGDYNFAYDYNSYWKTVTEFCHLAPDGTRLDHEGKIWYPPLGNGVKAAWEGLVPKPGALQTGEVVKVDGNGSAGNRDQRAAEGVTAGAAAGATAGVAAAAVVGESNEPNTEAQQIVKDHQAQEAVVEKRTDEGVSKGEQGEDGIGGIQQGMSEVAVAPPPAIGTAPGPPEGDVVFDHAPSKSEIKEARASMDQTR